MTVTAATQPLQHHSQGGLKMLAEAELFFADRSEAGRLLGKKLGVYADRKDVIVLALPRGGVPVGYEVAQALHAPLDVLLVRKLGVPGHEELAMGAVASGEMKVLNTQVLRALKISDFVVQLVAQKARRELRRREQLYRGSRTFPDVKDKVVIVVDDRIATGSTMVAAISALRSRGAARIVIAVPVAGSSAVEELGSEADEVVCLMQPERFYGVGEWYADFAQISDDDVRHWLQYSETVSTANGTMQARAS